MPKKAMIIDERMVFLRPIASENITTATTPNDPPTSSPSCIRVTIPLPWQK